jgi:AcrR family transcriptional regulator
MHSSVPKARISRAERRAQTRRELLDSAERVFIERGFEGASIEAITEAAGYTRGAFYSNFQSKEQLFAELLQERVYSVYAQMAQEGMQGEGRPTLREAGEQLAALQAAPEGQWLFRLWLELLAFAGRDPAFRKIAAGFWSTNRQLVARNIERAYEAEDVQLPVPAEDLASAMIALDIGLALQHFVDPEAAPLRLYPELYELLFSNPGR